MPASRPEWFDTLYTRGMPKLPTRRRTAAISAYVEMIGEQAPDLRLGRIAGGRAAQRCDGGAEGNLVFNRNGHAPSHTCVSDKA